MPPPPKHRRIPSSAIAAFIKHDEIDAILAPFVLDARDREWMLRCILESGPAHHRGANFVLLELLGAVLERLPAAAPRGAARADDAPRIARVPMRVPPHRGPPHEGPGHHGPGHHGPEHHGPGHHGPGHHGPGHHGPGHDERPPHEREADEDAFFPIGIPAQVLDRLAPAGSREQAAMIDCLTDGPPQHSLTNAAMVHLLGEILARLPEPAAPEPPPRAKTSKKAGP